VGRENAEKVQGALYRIAELASSAQDMQEFYRAVHEVVGEFTDATNCFIAIYDEGRQRINWPYFVDERDPEVPDPQQWFAFGQGDARGITAYVLRTGKPQRIPEARMMKLVEQGEVELIGELSEDWLGVPLRSAEGQTVGVLAVASYAEGFRYTEQDEELLAFVGQHIGAALSRARAIEETRQRNAELALINSVQAALAGELEMQAIYDVVGDRIQEIFDAQGVAISIVDEATGLVHHTYLIERGARIRPEPMPLGRGFTKRVLDTQEPLLIDEDLAGEAERYGSTLIADSEMPKSALFVPLVSGGRANGVIALDNFDREHAFDESDQRLLTTLAGSLSVALENARLVHETRQRNAELALINSVQEAIAGELDDQAIYNAVGENIREIFDAQAVQINTLDEATGLMHFPYVMERGEPLRAEPAPPGGFTRHVLETRQPLLLAENLASESERYGAVISAGEAPKSVLFVPLVVGGKAIGAISLQNMDRERAFGESDQQLLETLAGSLSVALENARLVHETRQRNAELALINGVQEAIAGELDTEAIYHAVGERIREVFDAQAVGISMLDDATGLLYDRYFIERGERVHTEPWTPGGFSKHVLATRESLLIAEDVRAEAERHGSEIIEGTQEPKSVLFVPLVVGGKATGVISLQNVDREHAYGESDRQLLETLAGSLSVALENARLVHETRQRNAELALINSVQEAIAGELDDQAIYDAVGDKIRDVFDAQVVVIRTLDEATGLTHHRYIIERGERLQAEPDPPGGFDKHVLETRTSILITENLEAEAERYGSKVLVGEMPKSVLFVPLVTGGKPTGVLSLQNIDREHAFGESDRQLLETLAGSLSVALENARLVHETRQRNAELALINSVQDALAGELELQAIYDAVGDRIRDVFDAQVVDIAMYDEAAGLIHFPYVIERGERFPDKTIEIMGFRKHVIETRETLRIDERVPEVAEQYGNPVVQGEMPSSVLYVPLISGGKATGVISLQNIDREHAFTDSDQQLLETLAGSLSVALENARLVHETRQRNAELALINSVQEALAGELEMQAIYDVVGDKIQEIFDAQVVDIGIFDFAAGVTRYPYTIERGVRFPDEPTPIDGSPSNRRILETKAPILTNDVPATERERGEAFPVVQGEPALSTLFAPLISGDEVRGRISLQNLDRTNAFTENDVRLLTTLAGSLSVALENARLVHETRQRNAELALINGVQDAIAGELEPQAIYDAVGERIRDVFDAQVVAIVTLDSASGLVHYPYTIELGERLQVEPQLPGGFAKHVLETRESMLVNEDVEAVAERYGSKTMAGEDTKSVLFVPLVSGGAATGVISLQNVDREHAFSASDQQLLETLAGSLSVALENARLVHETRQRNAELALINGVQDAIAGELDPQAIYEAVGERIRDVFDAHTMTIGTLDDATGLVQYPYIIERGKRLQADPAAPRGFSRHVLETREPLLIAENIEAEAERYGSSILAGEFPKSVLFVPLVVAGKSTGVISLQNVDREHAFSESDQQLLTTLAGSLSVALENARLVDETRQRVSELATVNSVGQALSSQLDLDALIELVGEQVRGTFDADIAYVALHDEAAGRIEFAYYYETGERRPQDPMEYGEGLTSQILRSREPLLLNRKEQYEGQASVGTPSRSYLGVPILVGERSIGVISVQSIEEEGRFGEADARVLATLAANVGVAIQNARLFAEVERQREYSASLVEISPAAVIVMDRGEVVTEWNPAAAALFGYSPEEAVGRHIDDLVFGDSSRDEGREVTAEAMRDGRAQRITTRSRKDGTPVDVELMLVPLVAEGAHSGFLGIYHDVTELQRARQEAEAATQAKSAFLATMSHEIRTPMNAVIGMTDLLLGTELTGEQREFAEVVHASGDALLHVIDDILDYSKIEAGKLDLERAPFSLRDCVEGALDIVAPRAWEKELELGCLIDEAAPSGIVGDEARLRQVLLNLLSNAVKFTERGEVVVLVDAEDTGAGSYRIELAVRDTGIGIPADRMGQLFTSFSQVDASTTRRFGGTGLGLAISKRLVELMGGAISVESEQGKGSTFRISLPAAAADVPTRIPLGDGLPHLAGKRILIVDDNATNREIVSRHARSWEMEPVASELPAAALELIAQGEPFDVAVLDMMMPEMDGVTLAREIRKHRSESDLPLLLLTSLGRLPQLQLEGVFSAQLSKPLKASQLYNALLQLLTAGRAGEEEVEAVTDGKRARSALRILLAEDNAMNQKVALRLLETLGYRADVAMNGLEAIAALERRPYDVVLMDVQMPELDGLDATRRIVAEWPEETRPHIIAMTANALPEDREACFAAGMNDYVAKPIRSEELAAALKRAKRLPGGAAESEDRVGYVSLDDGALQNLRDLGGEDFLREVIDAFLADAPALIATLRSSLDEQGAEELRRAAHTLKSNGATLGAEGFAELCRTLEQRAKAGELDAAAELVDRIEQEYRPLEEALSTLRSGTPA
jgi:PAS domain S-box-containing protein